MIDVSGDDGLRNWLIRATGSKSVPQVFVDRPQGANQDLLGENRYLSCRPLYLGSRVPEPFDGQVDEAWLKQELTDGSPDILQLAMQYVEGAPSLYDASGRKSPAMRTTGPLVDGTRKEGSDFNDYLGVAWTYGTSEDRPEEDELGSLDCSGFHAHGLGLSRQASADSDVQRHRPPAPGLPEARPAPGVVTINTGTQVTNFSRL